MNNITIAKVQDCDLRTWFVNSAELESPAKRLRVYDCTGKRLDGVVIHRGNLLECGASLSEAALTMQALIATGKYEIIDSTAENEEHAAALMGQGYQCFRLKDGQLIADSLGLVWARPSKENEPYDIWFDNGSRCCVAHGITTARQVKSALEGAGWNDALLLNQSGVEVL